MGRGLRTIGALVTVPLRLPLARYRVPRLSAPRGPSRSGRARAAPAVSRLRILGAARSVAWRRGFPPAHRRVSLRRPTARTERAGCSPRDRSGEWLYEALYRFGFSSAPYSPDPGDGLRLLRTRITAADPLRSPPATARPPGNSPPANRSSREELREAARAPGGARTRLDCLPDLSLRTWKALGPRGPGPRFPASATAQWPRIALRNPPARKLPPEPAEHVHGPAHPAHVPRGPSRPPGNSARSDDGASASDPDRGFGLPPRRGGALRRRAPPEQLCDATLWPVRSNWFPNAPKSGSGLGGAAAEDPA